MSAASPPDPERLRSVNALLEVALDLDDRERSHWLDNLPPEHRPLAPLLKTLLARGSVETDTFMREPVGLWMGEAEPLVNQAGDLIGPYRLVHELGAGGMATVWLAERDDGVLNRQVALKLPRAGWGLGLAQRMARERDILGALEHPHIARLYDAGVTEDGRPWMAMERVSGVPIDQYCREHALGVHDRLRLFLQVTDAVAHAHARLVVHRDLKPSNILVTPEGAVRLLDFGVAKLLEEPAGATSLTQLLGRAVTPDYASPEQVAGKPVTVATDVYSLGVVLYELLTGQRPYRLGRQSAAALEEAILAADVPLASSRIQTPPALARQLRGDIDTMLAKALNKKPALRYGSVESFAADLQRHLDGEPVLAQPPSRSYRVGKFVRRHRLLLASASAVTASIFIGLGAALWQAREARLEAARAEQVKEFIASIFKQTTPREGGVVTASEMLAAASRRIERELADNPRAAAELGVIVGEGFYSLGEVRKGAPTLRAAVERAERVHGRRHPITLHGKALLVVALNFEEPATSDRLLAELVPDTLAGLPGTAEDAVFALRAQAVALANQNRAAASYASLQQAIEIGERHLGSHHRDTIRAHGLLSSMYGRFGERHQQLKAAATAMTRAQTAFGAVRPHATLTSVERWYAEALTDNSRPAEALPILAQVLKDQRALDAGETPRVLWAARQLAVTTASAGRLAQALPLMREAVALEERVNPQDSQERAMYGHTLADVLSLARLSREALAEDSRIQRLQLPEFTEPAAWAIARDIRRAHNQAMLGEPGAAAQIAATASERAGDQHPQLRAEAWIASALNARLQGQASVALEFAQRVHGDPALERFEPHVHALAATELGLAWLQLGDPVKGGQALRRARQLFEQAQVEPGARTADVTVGLARLALQERRAQDAESSLQPLVSAWEGINPGSVWHGEALLWLSRAEAASGKVQAARAHRQQALAMLKTSDLPALRQLALR